jgi:hypothetical protein
MGAKEKSNENGGMKWKIMGREGENLSTTLDGLSVHSGRKLNSVFSLKNSVHFGKLYKRANTKEKWAKMGEYLKVHSLYDGTERWGPNFGAIGNGDWDNKGINWTGRRSGGKIKRQLRSKISTSKVAEGGGGK